MRAAQKRAYDFATKLPSRDREREGLSINPGSESAVLRGSKMPDRVPAIAYNAS